LAADAYVLQSMSEKRNAEKDMLREVAEEYDNITGDFLIEIYELENKLSVKERRIGISGELRDKIKKFKNS